MLPRPERGSALPTWTVDAVGFWCVLGYVALALLAR